MNVFRVIALAGAVFMSCLAATAGELSVKSAWTRAMLPGADVAVGYLTITNSGSQADRVVSVSSPVAAKTELHTMAMENNVMTMRPMTDGLEIPAGATVELKPGGDHLMLTGVTQPIQESEMVPVTLTFESGEQMTIELMVMPAGAKEMKHGG